MIEKRAVVEPGRTPSFEEARETEKRAIIKNQRQATETLDDDFTKRAADAAQQGLTKNGS